MTTVLVVDNSPMQRVLVRELLSAYGLTISEAESGRSAVAMAAKEKYDLVLMDIMLPDMNGIDALHAIRKLSGYEKTPIMALTACVMQGGENRFLEEGFTDYVSKPIDIPYLLRKVDKYSTSMP